MFRLNKPDTTVCRSVSTTQLTTTIHQSSYSTCECHASIAEPQCPPSPEKGELVKLCGLNNHAKPSCDVRQS